jgi:hypothetical protein
LSEYETALDLLSKGSVDGLEDLMEKRVDRLLEFDTKYGGRISSVLEKFVDLLNSFSDRYEAVIASRDKQVMEASRLIADRAMREERLLEIDKDCIKKIDAIEQQEVVEVNKIIQSLPDDVRKELMA